MSTVSITNEGRICKFEFVPKGSQGHQKLPPEDTLNIEVKSDSDGTKRFFTSSKEDIQKLKEILINF